MILMMLTAKVGASVRIIAVLTSVTSAMRGVVTKGKPRPKAPCIKPPKATAGNAMPSVVTHPNSVTDFSRF
jgi:hypothetical protein